MLFGLFMEFKGNYLEKCMPNGIWKKKTYAFKEKPICHRQQTHFSKIWARSVSNFFLRKLILTHLGFGFVLERRDISSFKVRVVLNSPFDYSLLSNACCKKSLRLFSPMFIITYTNIRNVIF